MKLYLPMLIISMVLLLVACSKSGVDGVTGNSQVVLSDEDYDDRMDACLNQFGLHRSECIQQLAFDSGNIALCERAGTYKNLCYTWSAKKLNDPEACVLANQMKDICLHQFER